jgi:hypothetical protein
MKKNYLLYILIPLVFVTAVAVLVACNYERGPMLLPTLTLPPANPTAANPNPQPTPTGEDQQVYPATPEAVVQAFLLALQVDQNLSLRYLSTTLKNKLPVNEPVDLLAVTGVIQGTAIQSGAVAMNPPGAEVVVGLQVDGKINLRRFNLAKEANGHWVISAVDKVE